MVWERIRAQLDLYRIGSGTSELSFVPCDALYPEPGNASLQSLQLSPPNHVFLTLAYKNIIMKCSVTWCNSNML